MQQQFFADSRFVTLSGARLPRDCENLLIRKRRSDENPLNFIERNLIVPTVVKFGCPRGFVARDRLRLLDRAAVEKKGGNAGRPKRMVADVRGEACGGSPALDHGQSFFSVESVSGQNIRFSRRGPEEGSFLFAS